MKGKKHIKYIHEGDYVAEVEVELIESDTGWAPYISLDDAYKMDDVREALRNGNIADASKNSQVYKLTPIS
ncbi:MAG: hypothetical protein JW874_06315 [Spirochaetales bacterium]|nr:hypothetical protein [Spirochaetales bacterium]